MKLTEGHDDDWNSKANREVDKNGTSFLNHGQRRMIRHDDTKVTSALVLVTERTAAMQYNL